MEATLILRTVVGLAVPCAAGWLLLGWAWPAPRRGAATAVLRAALAGGLGLGVSSCWFFLVGLLAGIAPPVVLAGDLLLLAWCGWLWRRRAVPAVREAEHGRRWPLLPALLLALVAAVSFVAACAANPHGDGDAMGIWNMRARFLLDAWGQWPLVFFGSALAHVDYPLLVPCAVVRLWVWGGEPTVLAPMAVAAVFTASASAVLFGALALARDRLVALFGLLALLGTPFFLRQGAFQTADVPMAFFLLAAFVPLLPGTRAGGGGVLVGLAMGCAAWSKNEGALFAVILLAGLVVARARAGPAGRGADRGVTLPAVLIGLLVPAAAVAIFKLVLASGNDLVGAQSAGGVLERATDLARYRQVGEVFLARLAVLSAEGEVLGCGFAVLAVYALLVGRQPGCRLPRLPALVLLAMALAYAAIFVFVSPYDLDWHLRTSVGRLLLQLWPATLLVAFSVLWVPGGADA